MFDLVETVGSGQYYINPIYDHGAAGGGSLGGGGSGGTGGSVFGEICDKGDMNCDGTLNGNDAPAFAAALRDPDAYMDTYLVFSLSSGDLDGIADGGYHGNGRIDFDDIDDFVSLMSGTGSGVTYLSMLTAIESYGRVPEPSAGVLSLLGGVLICAVVPRRKDAVHKNLLEVIRRSSKNDSV